MTAEIFYKIGGILLSVVAVYNGFLIFSGSLPFHEMMAIEPANQDAAKLAIGLTLSYSVFTAFSGLLNVVISRAGIPLGLFRALTLLNFITWGIVFIISIFYFSMPFILLQGTIFFAFLISYFMKPEFD